MTCLRGRNREISCWFCNCGLIIGVGSTKLML
jgi:hypothetical protein